MGEIVDYELHKKGGNKITGAIGFTGVSGFGIYEAVSQGRLVEGVIALPVLAFALYAARLGLQEIRQSKQA